jgi:ubiquinone/menaquinone biosynthesis C-methylase UbiE
MTAEHEKLKAQQYVNSSKFNARIHLHATYSTNIYPWPCWVWDQIEATDHAKVLELGGGNGLLWMANAPRIPLHWDITVTDFSPGMLEDARLNLSSVNPHIQYAVVDAMNIPYPDETFDIVIANHMLYHVKDRNQALSEIRRVLKQDGTFYATTVGSSNMLEMKQLVTAFDPNSRYEQVLESITSNFSLDNGAEQLHAWFQDVQCQRYEDALVVTDADALVEYVLSCNGLETGQMVLDPRQVDSFRDYINHHMKQGGGKIEIRKDSGIFISRS